jgi:hypothetical protein
MDENESVSRTLVRDNVNRCHSGLSVVAGLPVVVSATILQLERIESHNYFVTNVNMHTEECKI